jgi:probable F420-dependent oxidoreductase
MDFGVMMFPTHYSIGPAELAAAVEERGFGSLWFPEHTHIPTSRRTPFPAGGDLPRQYTSALDPFVALTAAACATRRIQIGTGVCLVVQRDPIITAKEVASLDLVSGGRFQFGVGAGWNREEMENHGTDPRTRMALLRERVLAMKEIWTREEAAYHGKFVDFDPIWSWPKPVQRPHPPVIIGGGGPGVIDRVLEFGDGWIPLNLGLEDTGAMAGRITELQTRAAELGRAPIPVTLFAASPRPDMLERYAEAGVTGCVFPLPEAPADEVLPLLDRYAGAIR